MYKYIMLFIPFFCCKVRESGISKAKKGSLCKRLHINKCIFPPLFYCDLLNNVLPLHQKKKNCWFLVT